MQPFYNLYIFIRNGVRGRLAQLFLVGSHFLLAVMAGIYLSQLPITASDPSRGLWFLLALAWGVPMTLIASLFYLVIIVMAIVAWQKQKPLKQAIGQFSHHRLINALLGLCLMIDIFYVLVLIPQSIWVFWVLLNMRV